MRGVSKELFSREGDSDPFDLGKADEALDFVDRHSRLEHPVIVSTWNRVYMGDYIEIQGYHMWLVLDLDWTGNLATIHDSGSDNVQQTSVTKLTPITLLGKERQLDMGLRGCITHSDYSCVAFWRA